MRVAHFDTGRAWRGGQLQVWLLMRGLRERGHDVILHAPPGPLAERVRTAGLPVVRWSPRLDWDPIAILAAAGSLSRFRADLAHCHTARAHGSAVPAAWLAGVPAVVSRRVPVAVGTHPLSRLKYGRGVARYLCVSRGVMESLVTSGIDRARLALVPSGVETPGRAEDPAADLHSLIGAPPQAPLIGTLAALTPEKDHARLLEAAGRVLAEIPEARFVWIGEGPCRAALERRRAELGLDAAVHLLGFRADGPRLLSQLTLFVLPSRFEGLGNAILEAQLAGVPVVATAVGGVPELIDDGVSGRLVPPGDAAALAAAMSEALRDRVRRASWAERARETAGEFGAERMVDRTLEQYRIVLDGMAMKA